jgi:hypothetical protein
MSGMERERERSISIWGGNESLRGGGGKDVGRRSVDGSGKRDRVTVRVCDGAS